MRLQSAVDLAFVVMSSLESARNCEKRLQHVELVTAKSMMTGTNVVVTTIHYRRR